MKKGLVSTLVFVFLIGMIFSMFPTQTYACSCIEPRPVEEELASSTAVFTGKVVKIDVDNKGPTISTGDPVKVTFDVAEVWKGPAINEITIETVRDSVSCGYEFDMGGEYIVYASGEEYSLTTSICTRTNELEAASTDLSVLGDGKAMPDVIEISDTKDNRLTIIIVLGFVILVIGLLTVKRRSER